MDYVRLGKMLSIGQYLALSNKAPRPNAGKAFIDFFLGDESMAILAKMGEFVNRKGILPAACRTPTRYKRWRRTTSTPRDSRTRPKSIRRFS